MTTTTTTSPSFIWRLKEAVFPTMPDFPALLNEQCDVLVETTGRLLEFMKNNSQEDGEAVRALEHRGDELKARNLSMLGQAFATCMDREDIRRATTTIDMVMNYCKTTIREMQILNVSPDDAMVEMVTVLHEGAMVLRDGYRHVQPGGTGQDIARTDYELVMKAERNIEKVYRRSIARLFTAEDELQALADKAPGAKAKAVAKVIEMFKRREVYRHLSNAGDELARAGSILRDIIEHSV